MKKTIKKFLRENRVRLSPEGYKTVERLDSLVSELKEMNYDISIQTSGKAVKLVFNDFGKDLDVFFNLSSEYYNNEFDDEVEQTYLMRICNTNYIWQGGNEDELENDFVDMLNIISKKNLEEACISADFQRAVTGTSVFIPPACNYSSKYNKKYNTFKLDFYGEKYSEELDDGSD